MSYQYRGLHFEECELGKEYYTARRTVTEADVALFAGLSGDFNPLHVDQVMMEKTPFGRRIAHGALVAAIATGLANQTGMFEGTTIAFLEQTTRWPAPTFPGDTLHMVLSPIEKKESSKPDRGLVVWSIRVVKHTGETVMEGQWKTLMKRRTEGGE